MSSPLHLRAVSPAHGLARLRSLSLVLVRCVPLLSFLLLLVCAASLPFASGLYASGDGYSLNGAMRVPELHIGGLDVGWTLLRLVQRMSDAEQRIDAQQAQIDWLLGANARLQANLTDATERVRQLEALNGTVRAQGEAITDLQSSNSSLAVYG